MKKHILLGAALLSLFAASCSNDDIINNDNEVVNGKTITLNASINNGADTRMTYTDDPDNNKMTVAWSSEESFTMYKGTNGNGSTFTKTAESGSKFKGNDITGEGDYYAVYGNNISNNNGKLTIDLSGVQMGTKEENGIKEFMLATADALTSSTTLKFDHKLTVLKMTLTLPSDVEGTVNKVTVSGLHNKATYTLSADAYDAYADADKGDITATNGGTGFEIKATVDGETTKKSFTAYVAVFPENVSANQVTINAYVGYNEYYYTIAGVRELAAGKVVPVNVTLVKRNLKSKYTGDDYKTWSEENCRSAVSYDDMCKYLGAGVYWDAGSTSGDGYYNSNVQTYTVGSIECHTGLWVKKKKYIEGFSAGSAKTVTEVSSENNSDCWNEGRPAADEIGKYFFLPAAGYYGFNRFFYAGYNGRYYSSSSNGDNKAYSLYFTNSGANVQNDGRTIEYLFMVPE